MPEPTALPPFNLQNSGLICIPAVAVSSFQPKDAVIVVSACCRLSCHSTCTFEVRQVRMEMSQP
jgi:hypothetical protein